VPRQAIRARRALHFLRVGAAERHRQVDDLIARLSADVERCRKRIVVRHAEGGAVREDTGGAAKGELADRQQIAFELVLGEPPAVRREGVAPRFDESLEVAILLLKMLGLEEESF
jgi:hypothetical protein